MCSGVKHTGRVLLENRAIPVAANKPEDALNALDILHDLAHAFLAEQVVDAVLVDGDVDSITVIFIPLSNDIADCAYDISQINEQRPDVWFMPPVAPSVHP